MAFHHDAWLNQIEDANRSNYEPWISHIQWMSSTGFATRQRLNGPEPVKERSANGNLKDSAPGPSSFPVPWLDGMNIPVAVWITYNFDFNRVTTFHSEHSTFFISNISMLRRHIPTLIVHVNYLINKQTSSKQYCFHRVHRNITAFATSTMSLSIQGAPRVDGPALLMSGVLGLTTTHGFYRTDLHAHFI